MNGRDLVKGYRRVRRRSGSSGRRGNVGGATESKKLGKKRKMAVRNRAQRSVLAKTKHCLRRGNTKGSKSLGE